MSTVLTFLSRALTFLSRASTFFQHLTCQELFINLVTTTDMTVFMTHDHFKPFFDNVFLEHDGPPNVLPLAVNLDFLCCASRWGNSKSLLQFEFSY